MNDQSKGGMRIDRWLWCARFFKTRSEAAAATSGGHVKINDKRAKPGDRVGPGDRLHIVRDQVAYDVQILLLPARRGPAVQARLCYREDEGSRLHREARLESSRLDRRTMPRTAGKPDKHTRRQLRQFNRTPRDD
jgi:ribosome-associated heat shock protein Hsp15